MPEILTESTYRGGIHNCEITTAANLNDVNKHLYAAVVEKEFTYEFPIDSPTYAQVYLYTPDDVDIQESIEANE